MFKHNFRQFRVLLGTHFFVFQEAAELIQEDQSAQSDLKDLESQFNLSFLSGFPEMGPRTYGDSLSPRDFLAKYKPVLETNFDCFYKAFSGNLNLSLRYDPTYLDQLVEIGRAYASGPHARNYVTRFLGAVGDSIESDRKVGNDEIDRDPKRFFERLFRKMADQIIASYERNPLAVVLIMDDCEKHYPTAMDRLKKLIEKSIAIPDRDFHALADICKNWHQQKNNPKFYNTALNVLLRSEDKPFDTIVGFKKISAMVVRGYPVHKSKELVNLTLNRGSHFLDEDLQTVEWVNKLLEEQDDLHFGRKVKPHSLNEVFAIEDWDREMTDGNTDRESDLP